MKYNTFGAHLESCSQTNGDRFLTKEPLVTFTAKKGQSDKKLSTLFKG